MRQMPEKGGMITGTAGRPPTSAMAQTFSFDVTTGDLCAVCRLGLSVATGTWGPGARRAGERHGGCGEGAKMALVQARHPV